MHPSGDHSLTANYLRTPSQISMGNRVVAVGLGNERDRSPGHNFNRDCIPDCFSHQLDGLRARSPFACTIFDLRRICRRLLLLQWRNISNTKEGGRPKHSSLPPSLFMSAGSTKVQFSCSTLRRSFGRNDKLVEGDTFVRYLGNFVLCYEIANINSLHYIAGMFAIRS